MTGYEVTIITAAATFIGTLVIDRMFFLPSGVRDSSAKAAHGLAPESTGRGVRGRDRPTRVRGQGGGVHGPASAVESDAIVDDEQPRDLQLDAYLPASEHIERFIAWVVVGIDGKIRKAHMTHEDVHQRYLDWTAYNYVVPLPEKTFQTLMKRHPQVVHDRVVQKDAYTGRVLRKPSGAPERITYYTVRPPRGDVLPGKVPVGDIVPARKLESKAERAASLAGASVAQSATAPPRNRQPQPDQPQQPLPRAA